MDTLYHLVAGLFSAVVLAELLKTISTRSFTDRFTWATFLVSFLIYFREVTQFQTKNFESSIFTGWNPWSQLYPWSIDKQLETFVPIAVLVTLTFVIYWFIK